MFDSLPPDYLGPTDKHTKLLPRVRKVRSRRKLMYARSIEESEAEESYQKLKKKVKVVSDSSK